LGAARDEAALHADFAASLAPSCAIEVHRSARITTQDNSRQNARFLALRGRPRTAD